MKSGVLKFSVLIGLLFFFSCKEEQNNQWPDPVIVPLSTEAKQWFNQWNDTTFTIQAFSSDGLTDAYRITARIFDDSTDYEWYGNQRIAIFRKIFSYRESIYGNQFYFGTAMKRFPNFYFAIEFSYWNDLPDDYNPNNFSTIFDSIFHPNGYTTRDRDHYTYEDTFHTTVSYIGTYTINNKTYHEVYKYENQVLMNQGVSFDIVELYFDKHYGLLQFKYKNGRVWTLVL